MYACNLCGNEYKLITNTHLNEDHKIDLRDYMDVYGSAGCGFAYQAQKLPKDDARYLHWRKSLNGRGSWNRGHTKDTLEGLKRLSITYKKKGINNFSRWMSERKKQGIIASSYPGFKKMKI